MNSVTITSGYMPGAIGAVTQLHGAYYAEHWKLGLYFEAKVATELAAFLNRYNPAHDGLWLAHTDGTIIGAIVIDGIDADTQGARLRWFILAPGYQGRGIGSQLMNAAMHFCRESGFRRVYLTTFAGLASARHLYEKHGFRLYHEEDGSHLTGTSTLVEQQFEILL